LHTLLEEMHCMSAAELRAALPDTERNQTAAAAELEDARVRHEDALSTMVAMRTRLVTPEEKRQNGEEGERRREGGMSNPRGRDKEGPEAVPIDPEAERRELEAAGWKRIETLSGKVVWRHPASGYLYPQGPAIARLRRDLASEDEPD
jgi:hypothetical protein